MKLRPAPTEELERVRWELVGAFRARWRAYRTLGYIDTLRRSVGQRRLVEMVRAEIGQAVYPTTYWHPSRPIGGRNLPGPEDSRHPYDRLEPGAVEAWIARDPFVREGHKPHIAAHLAYIETFKPKGRAW